MTLAVARRSALKNRREIEAGRDPRGGGIPTFVRATDKVIALHRDGWKPGSRTESAWRNGFSRHVYPDTRPVRGALVGVVNTLREQDRVIATLEDLAELLPGRCFAEHRPGVAGGWLAVRDADPRCVGIRRVPSWRPPGAGVSGTSRPDAGPARHPGVHSGQDRVHAPRLAVATRRVGHRYASRS
ncbi:MAG: hypothetical protein J4G11_02145 [Acidimicrobiia bacterium]|nr:hypothetical protein [Acidimicrobiia bacterium]